MNTLMFAFIFLIIGFIILYIDQYYRYQYRKPKEKVIIYKCDHCNSTFKYRQSKWTHEQKCKLIDNTLLLLSIASINISVGQLLILIEFFPSPNESFAALQTVG